MGGPAPWPWGGCGPWEAGGKGCKCPAVPNTSSWAWCGGAQAGKERGRAKSAQALQEEPHACCAVGDGPVEGCAAEGAGGGREAAPAGPRNEASLWELGVSGQRRPWPGWGRAWGQDGNKEDAAEANTAMQDSFYWRSRGRRHTGKSRVLATARPQSPCRGAEREQAPAAPQEEAAALGCGVAGRRGGERSSRGAGGEPRRALRRLEAVRHGPDRSVAGREPVPGARAREATVGLGSRACRRVVPRVGLSRARSCR